MKTRTGKISQLPKSIRDELNHRLQNGKQGPELLPWLNSLPETKELITTKFDHHPINRQNLTEWRHGGYEDWLQHQQREWRIQRVTEEGSDLEKRELKQDAFEHSARFALAELMADFDSLHQLQGQDRFQRLCALTRQLTRLQDSFNRSRWSALAWTRWNERFFGPANYDHRLGLAEKDAPPPQRPVPPAPTPISDSRSPNSPEIKPIQTNSTEGGGPPKDQEVHRPAWIIRNIGHHQGCGCICKHCHPESSDYPYHEAVADQNEAKRLGTLKIWRGLTALYIRPTKCDLPCAAHPSSAPRPTNPEPGRIALPRDPIIRHAEVRDENPSVPLPEMSPAIPPDPRPPVRRSFSEGGSPLIPPYDSVAASLRRISLLETRSQRTA